MDRSNNLMAPHCCFISKVETNLKKHSSKKHSSYFCAFFFGHRWSLHLQSNISWCLKVEPKSVRGSTHELASASTAAQRNVFRLKLPSVPTVYPTLHHLTSSFSSSHHQQISLFCSILNPPPPKKKPPPVVSLLPTTLSLPVR